MNHEEENPNLTPREEEAIKLSARDFSVKMIAALWIKSEHTVKNHIYAAKRKLKTSTIGGAIGKAIKIGIIKQEEL